MKTFFAVLVVVVFVAGMSPTGENRPHTAPTTPSSSPSSSPMRKFKRLFSLGRTATAAPTLAQARQAYMPLLSVRTPPERLPGLIRDFAARVDSWPIYQEAAVRITTAADAVLLCDRIRDGPYSAAVQAGLLRLLVAKVAPTAFFAVVAADMVSVGDDADRAVLARFPLGLLTDLPHLDLVAHVNVPVPDAIMEKVWAVAGALPEDWLRPPAGYDLAGVRDVRGQFPAPFHLVFPFGQYFARQLLPELARLAPDGERRAAVLALARLGVRFDQLDVLDLGLDPHDPDLPWLVALSHPRRSLFDGLRYNPDHGGSLRAACAAVPAPGADVVARLERHRAYLPRLYETPAFVALLRRQPDLFTAAVALLPPAETYPPLAAQAFLAYPEFAGLANLLFHELLQMQVRAADPKVVAALQALVVLPQVGLYQHLSAGRSVLGYLCQFPEIFRPLLCSRELLGRLASDPDGFARYLDGAGHYDRVFVQEFLDGNCSQLLVGQLCDRMQRASSTSRRFLFGSRRSRRAG